MRGLPPVAASGGHSSSQCAGLSVSRPLLWRSTSSRRAGSVAVAHGPSCSTVCGIFPDQGSNPCPLYWQADSQPLRHQGSSMLLCLMLSQRSLKLSSFLFILFSLFRSAAVISTHLSSSSLIRSSASFILLLIPSSVFFISVIVLFNSVCSLNLLVLC